MIKFLLAALILLNVSVLANVEIEDEEEEDLELADDSVLDKTVDENDNTITKMKGTPE